MSCTYNVTVYAYSGSVINVNDIVSCLSHCSTSVSCSYVENSSSFSPNDVLGLRHWFKSDEGVELSGSSVVAWNDLVGTSDGDSVSLNRRPMIVSGSVNGYPKIRFNEGISQDDQALLQTLRFGFNVPQPWSLFIVWQRYAPSSDTFNGTGNDVKALVLSTYDSGSYPNDYERIALKATNTSFYVSGTCLEGNASSIGTSQVINSGTFGSSLITAETGSMSLFNDGYPVIVGNTGFDSLLSMQLSARHGDFRQGAYIDVVEMMVYTGSLSSTQIVSLTDYVNDRYAL